MTNKMYVLIEETERNTGVVGIFYTKKRAESYMRNYQLTYGRVNMYDTPEYYIYEHPIAPNLNRPKEIHISGDADYGSDGLEVSCNYEDKTEDDIQYCKKEHDGYYFSFFLDVSGLDKDISIEDYHNYIVTKSTEFVMDYMNKRKIK